MPNIKNLKPYKKGQSGNPTGRKPEIKELRLFLIEILSEVNQKNQDKSNLELLAQKMIALGISGNLKAIELIFNFAYGKPKELGEKNDIIINSVIMPKPILID